MDSQLLIDTPIERISDSLNSTIPELMDKYKIAGLSVAVIRDEKTVISKSFGYSDIESNKEMDADSVYRAASLGKPIFAYVVVKLSQQGVIDLDKSLHSYTDKRIIKSDPRSELITARMVLSHSTGLPNLDVKFKDIKFEFNPGEEFKYSGHAYLYLQDVVENITGNSLDELVEDIVFSPLQMTKSSFKWKDQYTEYITSSYKNTGEKYPVKELPLTGFSAWSLFTTLNDYSIFVSHIISTSNDQNSVASMLLEPNVKVADGVEWGLGWGLQDTEPFQSFWHWGSNPGFKHYVVGYSQEKVAVIVMSNSDDSIRMIDKVMVEAIGGSYPSYKWL